MSCTNCIWYDALAGCGKVKWDEKGNCVNFESSKTILVSECWKCKKHDGKNGCGVADFNAEGYCNNFDFDEVKEEKVDNVNHPKHYEKSCSLECIEAMELMGSIYDVATFCFYNAFKYVWRYKNKNGKEDLKKAKWYIDRCYYYNHISESIYDVIDKDRLSTLNRIVEEKMKEYEK